MKQFLLIAFGFLIALSFLGITKTRAISKDYLNLAKNLTVTSDSFKNEGDIPVKYTGYGEDLSPQLSLANIDSSAKIIAIIMDDEDHPIGTYNHWLIWNIPASHSDIPENVARTEVVPELGNAIQGKSCYGGKHYYRGPKPPFGTHKYVFKVYVLDTVLNIDKDSNKRDLHTAMKDHILQYGEIEGNYSKK